MKWKPLQGSLRPVNPFGSKFRLLMGLFVVLFSIFLLPIQTLSALEEQLAWLNASVTKIKLQ
ncbi:hypothetical protein [Streptococcus sanguinis]|uniref:Fibril-like structure subunit FibA n=1 Tax=Streptococcus sanguinis TaxID=1305 RepID=A0A2X3VPM7_STRSA|nr:hypothetical protein [Streptococcus sanguinis]EGJ43813.1 hypothetical protein HMPREF9396_1198 [Streptococcus sanguinis SK1059]EGQ19690.1 hypothetical protein HMPREF8573_1188 [Streptococcus sanguinis ATCC 29667]EGQ23536.1 hypothetical protein HMPREF9387_1741 [Streptococcus sanguinis SK340]MCY7015295.1 hypothetical protein [Streptococcus sanguinis]RSI12961.1 hypothetical protein D8885_07580 [Streptococcus sanguinis]